MNWISLEELLLIHARVIEETGGAQGTVNPGGVESALARPFTAFDGTELFADLPAKVAALVHALIQFHPFVDGNKRTALVAADVCLRPDATTPNVSPPPAVFSRSSRASARDLAAALSPRQDSSVASLPRNDAKRAVRRVEGR